MSLKDFRNPERILLGFLLNGHTIPFKGYDCRLSLSEDTLVIERWTRLISSRVEEVCIIDRFFIDDFLIECSSLDKDILYSICSNLIIG